MLLNNFIKRLFKKDSVYIHLPESIFKDRKILSYEDFYKKSGVLEYTEKMRKENKYNTYHVDNVRANNKTQQRILTFITDNVVNTKNKYSKIYTEKKLRVNISFESLVFSPSTDESVKDNYIKILKPFNKQYKQVTEETIDGK